MKDLVSKVIKNLTFWIIVVELILLSLLFLLGFKLTYAPWLENKWEAITAIGEWGEVFVGILIPIVAVYIQRNIDKNKKDIGESNVALLEELKQFKNEYIEKINAFSKSVSANGGIVTDERTLDNNELKQMALKYVTISLACKTPKVAEYLGIDQKKAYEILLELFRQDKTISAGGQVTESNISNIIWTKKE